MNKFDINTSDIFSDESSFWIAPSKSQWPTYSYEDARVVENLVIEHFKSNSPSKIIIAPDYEDYIRRRSFSILDKSFIDNSPFQIADGDEKTSDEEKKIRQLFSRLMCWTDDFIVSKEQVSENFFEIMFAFSLRRCNVTDVFDFLDYQLSTNFESSQKKFLRFLKQLTNKYLEILFYPALSETIYDWIDEQEFEKFQVMQSIFPNGSYTSYQLLNPDDEANLEDVLNALKRNKFVASSTSLPTFKRLFKGMEVTTPVVWNGSVPELYYFISLIHREKKKIKKLHHDIWKVTVNCFVPPDGGIFNAEIFSSQHIPKNERAKILQGIANNF